jgi:hypothetical protein
MSEEPPETANEAGLRTQHDTELINLPDGRFRHLSEIINRSLVCIQTSKALAKNHRVGGHELCDPDYRLVCAYGEELNLPLEEVLTLLLNDRRNGSDDYFRSILRDGHFVRLYIDQSQLPTASFPAITGLKVTELVLSSRGGLGFDLSGLKPKSLPDLVDFCCVSSNLQELDLSPFPLLERLQCQVNQLTKLDLSHVPNLRELRCSDNQLKELDLSPVKGIKVLWCGVNQLMKLDLSKSPNLEDLRYWNDPSTKLDISNLKKLKVLGLTGMRISSLDLSPYPVLTELYCNKNILTNLDLSSVPNLISLNCSDNQIIELDVRNLSKLEALKCDPATRILQRPDQNFK